MKNFSCVSSLWTGEKGDFAACGQEGRCELVPTRTLGAATAISAYQSTDATKALGTGGLALGAANPSVHLYTQLCSTGSQSQPVAVQLAKDSGGRHRTQRTAV